MFVTELSYFHPNVFLITVPTPPNPPDTIFTALVSALGAAFFFPLSVVCSAAVVNTRPAPGVCCCQILPETRPRGHGTGCQHDGKEQVKATETFPGKRASSCRGQTVQLPRRRHGGTARSSPSLLVPIRYGGF